MGRAFSHFNAYERKLEGWLGRCNMVTAPTGGTFNVRVLETASNTVQAVRVPAAASLCPTEVGAPCEYLIEYRWPLGFDGQGTGISGVQVRLASRDLRRTSYLLDMTPQTTTFTDAALAIGRTFQDPNGVAISVTARERHARDRQCHRARGYGTGDLPRRRGVLESVYGMLTD